MEEKPHLGFSIVIVFIKEKRKLIMKMEERRLREEDKRGDEREKMKDLKKNILLYVILPHQHL